MRARVESARRGWSNELIDSSAMRGNAIRSTAETEH